MRCDVSCKYYPMCWYIKECMGDIGDDCDEYKPERPHGEWIPLKWEDEETKCKILDYPYDGKWVIVTDGKNISVERIKIDAIDHFYPAGRWFELEDVIAWMPLPEPYRKEGEAE